MTRLLAYSKLGPGEYFLINNERSRAALIRRYWEDGSLSILQKDGPDRVVRGFFWQTIPVREHYLHRDTDGLIDGWRTAEHWEDEPWLDDWNWTGPYDSMREAMDAFAETTEEK